MRVRYDGGVGPVGAGVGERRGRPWGGAVRVGMRVRYDGGFAQVAAEIGELERAGLQLVSVAEAYSFDAVRQLGSLAAGRRAPGGSARCGARACAPSRPPTPTASTRSASSGTSPRSPSGGS